MLKSLYLHIPFCRKKCLYCGFSIAVGQKHYFKNYMDCIKKEAVRYPHASMDSFYFGGGTPSELSENEIYEFLSAIKEFFDFPAGAEITFEANPESMTREKINILVDAGVDRLSLGAQTFNIRWLKYLGRTHNSCQIEKTYAEARESGFKNINVDLMFGFPGQTIDELKSDIDAVVRLGPEHVSVYQLTIEPNSRFYVDRICLDKDDYLSQQYEFVIDELEQAGFIQYEVSNFAKTGKMSQHNLNYWRGGNYIGLGVSAHSHIDGHRYWNEPQFLKYLSKMQSGQIAVVGEEHLSAERRLTESLLFGLRMIEGVNIVELERRYGSKLREEQEIIIERFINEGFLQQNKSSTAITRKGLIVLDEICTRLV